MGNTSLEYNMTNKLIFLFSSCFLNPKTHFIWAFIAPVMIVIFINIGFFLMAALRLWHQRKKKIKGNMDRKNIMAWLKAVTFLLLVMGITWILGLLVVNLDVLLPLAYIYTIMVAFQGLAIFLAVVGFQKSVQNDCIKWWKGKVKRSLSEVSFHNKYSSTPSNVTVSIIIANNGFESSASVCYPFLRAI